MTTNDTETSSVDSIIVQVMAGMQRSSEHTMNQLYNYERQRRLALEVWIEDYQNALDIVHGGTYREMDSVLRQFSFPPMGYDEERRYAMRHTDWSDDL